MESIINTLKKLYIKYTNAEFHDEIKNYDKFIFDKEKKEFFVSTYFSDFEFCETPEFELGNRLYQFIKLLAIQFKYPQAVNFFKYLKKFPEPTLLKQYAVNKKRLKDFNSSLNNDEFLLINDNFIQKYFSINFFETISRNIHVQKGKNTLNDLFTVNPLVKYLSGFSKTQFEEYVPRDTRFTKLFNLIEHCEYFFDEVKYNSGKLRHSWILRQFDKVNYFVLEACVFLFTIVINIIIAAKVDHDEYKKIIKEHFP